MAYKALHGLVCGTSVTSLLTQITLLTFSFFIRLLDIPQSKSMRLPQGLCTHCFLCLEHLSSDICMASFFIPFRSLLMEAFQGYSV